MAEIKNKVGKMKCETCGETVTVKANEKGTLSYSCQECDAAPYARAGTGQNAHWRRKMTPSEGAPQPHTLAAENKKPASTMFD